jgi:3-hydroxyisobutyrate dehydrogenase-like beta-hydroxyacid dehydrogenase
VDTRKTIGILGLGLVGMALARRLIALGFTVYGFDVIEAKQDTAMAMGITWVPRPELLSTHGSVLILAVLDDAALRAGTDELLQADADILNATKLVVSCVTASQRATLDAARKFQQAGASFVDLPLLGSSQQIERGEAIGLLGASGEVLERWAAELAAISPNLRHVGDVGFGVAAKLACNLVLGLNRSALAEGMALAQGFGIEPKVFLSLLQGSPAYSKAVDIAGPRMAARDFKAVSRIAQHRKDIGLILDATRELGMKSFLASAQAALLDEAIEQGLGELDNVAVVAAYDRNRPR